MTQNLRSRLKDPSLLVEAAQIGSAWCAADAGETIAVSDPATGETLGTVPNCGKAETLRAIEAAKVAFRQWSRLAAAERARLLERWHDLLVENREDLATIMTAEQGKPYPEALGEVGYGASFLKWFAEEARRVYGEVIPGQSSDRRIMVVRQPIGVTAAITPWNFPIAMITRKAGPALAAGCTMVVKPADLTPYCALALGVLAERAGIPAGVLNFVTGDAAEIGSTLCESPTVRKLSFTGSTRVGKILMRQCTDTVKRLSLELGGNAPLLVFDDADLDVAVDGAIASKFRNAGQTCVCANRIYVQSGIYDAFAHALTQKVLALKVGDGFSQGAQIGPLINEAALQKAESHVADALELGAELLCGGNRIGEPGRYFAPTVLSKVTQSMLITQEETFGPVAPLVRFETEEEVIDAANDTPFGLAAYVFTRDLARSLRVSESLEVGMVGLNTGAFATEVAPFGGVKESGLGREGSRHGIEEFVEMKTIHIAGI
jgi:succinate-semialdehyde dehydrogenase/glutarate-semialdehyde dehydrogenase